MCIWNAPPHADLRRLVGGQRRVRVAADSRRQRNTPQTPPAIPGQGKWHIETRVLAGVCVDAWFLPNVGSDRAISCRAMVAAKAVRMCGAKSGRPNFFV